MMMMMMMMNLMMMMMISMSLLADTFRLSSMISLSTIPPIQPLLAASSPTATSTSPLIISPLMMSFEELSEVLGGTGKAKLFWTMIRDGTDPLGDGSLLSMKTRDILMNRLGFNGSFRNGITDVTTDYNSASTESMNPSRASVATITTAAASAAASSYTIAPTTIVEETISPCGGRKQLHRLHSDELQIESVIIPHNLLPRTTLCVSNQVGEDLSVERKCILTMI
jgi:hypothetical protein